MHELMAKARHLRAALRELLDDADSGRVCLTQNAKLLAEKAVELQTVEDEINTETMARNLT
jgi:hypothetical protein